MAKPKVLIAEDNPQGAELIHDYLDGEGWELRIAVDGDDTLKQVKEWQPDVLLLDIMMPKLSGFEVCKRIRRDPTANSLPVLMITALDQASDIDRAVDAGTTDFMTKPIHKADLVYRVKALLKADRQASEVERTISYMRSVAVGE